MSNDSNDLDLNWIPIQPLISPVPIAWIHRKTGEVRHNLDYIEPALPPETAQYEQALVGYELCEKASRI